MVGKGFYQYISWLLFHSRIFVFAGSQHLQSTVSIFDKVTQLQDCHVPKHLINQKTLYLSYIREYANEPQFVYSISKSLHNISFHIVIMVAVVCFFLRTLCNNLSWCCNPARGLPKKSFFLKKLAKDARTP